MTFGDVLGHFRVFFWEWWFGAFQDGILELWDVLGHLGVFQKNILRCPRAAFRGVLRPFRGSWRLVGLQVPGWRCGAGDAGAAAGSRMQSGGNGMQMGMQTQVWGTSAHEGCGIWMQMGTGYSAAGHKWTAKVEMDANKVAG